MSSYAVATVTSLERSTKEAFTGQMSLGSPLVLRLSVSEAEVIVNEELL